MLKYERYIEDFALTLTGTDRIELPNEGVLTAIQLDFRMANAATLGTADNQRITDRLTNIAVTDGGSRIMTQLRGQQWKILNYNQNHKTPTSLDNLYSGKLQQTSIVIPFGRYIGDAEFGFDLSAFSQSYLEITNSLTATQTVAGFVTVQVELIYLYPPATAPQYYLKHYEFLAEKPSADGQHVYVDIPANDPIYWLMCQLDPDLDANFKPVHTPVSDLNTLALTAKNRSVYLLDHRPMDIMYANANIYGMPITHLQTPPTTPNYYDSYLGIVSAMASGGVDHGAGCAYAIQNPFVGRYILSTACFAALDAETIMLTGAGYINSLTLIHEEKAPVAGMLNPGKSGPDPQGPVRIDWGSSYDDHYLRTCIGVPITQGQT